jgi:hypothetical protein
MHTKVWPENLNGWDHLEDVGVGGRIILKWTLEEKWRRMDWSHLA